MTSTLAERAVRGAGVDLRPVASYGRISKRRTGDGGGASVKIEVQHSDNSAKMHDYYGGADVVTYDDNMSAWDEDVRREDWERLLVDVASGNYRAVIAWHADRFTRQPLQLELLWRAAKRGRCAVWTYSQGLITDPTMLRIEGALAARDSDIKSEKITRRHQMIAEAGQFHGGRRRFGYDAGMMTLREDEAAVIRDAAARVLRGESLASIAREYATRGVETPEGGEWTGPNLGRLLRRPHLAGLRVYHGEVTGKATWPAVLDETTHANLVALLSQSSRRTSTSNARVYLLAGLAVCDACGAPLRGRPLRKRDGRAYACATGRHCHRPVELIDSCVETLIVDRLSRMDASGALVDDALEDDIRAHEMERATLLVKLDALTDKHLDGDLSDDQLARSTRRIESRVSIIDSLLADTRAAAAAPALALADMTGQDASQAWQNASLGRRRRIIDYLCSRVALRGAETRRAPFDPSDVIVEWRSV